jgi:HEAT repeat protein
MQRLCLLGLCLGIWLASGDRGLAAGADKEQLIQGKTVQEWLARLKDKDATVRKAAAEALGDRHLGTRPVLNALLAAFKDVDAGVRVEAAHSFWQLRPGDERAETAIQVLVEGLKHRDSAVRSRAAALLGQTTSRTESVLSALQTAQDDKNVDVRVAAVCALSRNQSPKGAAVLVEALTGKYAASTRLTAAAVLSWYEVPAPEAIPVLRAAIKEENAGLRVHAAAALWNLDHDLKRAGPVLVEALGDEDSTTRACAASALQSVLFVGSGQWSRSQSRQYNELKPQVEAFAAAALPALIDSLKDKDKRVREYIIGALRGLGPKAQAAGPALIALVKSGAELPYHISDALGALGPEMIPLLLKLLEDPDAKARCEATRGLTELIRQDYMDAAMNRRKPTDMSAVARALFKALQDKDAAVRVSAAYAVLNLGPKRKGAMGGLLACLKDRDPWVRQAAASVLGQMAKYAEEAVPDLLRALKEPDVQMRMTAAAALWAVHSQDDEVMPVVLEALKGDNQSRSAALQVIQQIGPSARAAMPEIIQMLKDSNLQSSAASALAQMAQGSDAEPVVAALIKAAQDKDRELCKGAVYALGHLYQRAERAVPTLLELLKNDDPKIRQKVAWSLGALRSIAEKGLPALKRLEQQDPDREVRQAAAEARKRIEEDVELRKPLRELEERAKKAQSDR